MSLLVDLGISKSESKSSSVFCAQYPTLDSLPNISSPSQFVLDCWSSFESIDRDLRGHIFEYIICVLLIKLNIKPFAIQANLSLLPTVRYDILLFPHGNIRSPIALSLKTSLRERYKQADLEAILLRQIFMGAKTYLITLEQNLSKRNEDIEMGLMIGINQFISPEHSDEFDKILNELSSMRFARIDSIPMFSVLPMWIEP